ncbi:MAG TPA: ABC transporter permease [Gaiellaceae bacterium]|nr:ABC transporter permease [Gaiellaceae bacterium]
MTAAKTATTEHDVPVQIIGPIKGWVGFDLRELWEYRELTLFFAWRTILIRYKQTALGIAWAVLQPLLLMVVMTLFFGSFAKKAGVPGPIFFFAGLVPWTFFANGLGQSSNSLVGNANLLSKVYFPRLVAPIAAVTATLLDFLLAFLILIGMMVWYGIYPRPIAIVVIPGLVVLTFAAALGLGLWLSALNVHYRDVQYVIPFLIQLGLFASGVVYAATTLAEPWQTLLGLNPMAGVVTTFRWALLGTPGNGAMLLLSIASTIVISVCGVLYFRRREQTFADVL